MTEMQMWEPTAPEGQKPEDLPLINWVGQALGAASTYLTPDRRTA